MSDPADLITMLRYNPQTGEFHWRINRGRGKAGARAGALHSHLGYRVIRHRGANYYEHRLAWLYVHGAFPASGLDHINGNRADNRISNLRPATQAQNILNRGRQSNNTSGFKGVSRDGDKWVAEITINKRRRRLGHFSTPEAAHEAYCGAAAELGAGYVRSS